MVNINIELPDELHKQLKLASLLHDQTLKEHVIHLLATALKNTPPTHNEREKKT